MKKAEIEELLQSGRTEVAGEALELREKQYPKDADIPAMKTALALQQGDMEDAYQNALEGVKRLPLNPDMQYNYAYVCELLGDWVKAYIAYRRAAFLLEYRKEQPAEGCDPEERTRELLLQVEEALKGEGAGQIREVQEILSAFQEMEKNHFGLYEGRFRSPYFEDMIGAYYYESVERKKYVGYYKDQYYNNFKKEERPRDVMRVKAEFIPVTEGDMLRVGEEAEEYIVPIASAKENNILCFRADQKNYVVEQAHSDTFNWYRVPAGTLIGPREQCYYGRPIPLVHDKKRKKLVMSIFVDGLSEIILKEGAFERNMPNTRNFFKKGTIFTEAYNNAEWTYPSIASYVTGLDTPHHMLFHAELDYAMPEDHPVLPEIFQKAGYHTSKYCGNWRIIPSYGHGRGYDRFVYQHQKTGFKVQEVIAETLNQLEAFSETDQYIWISIGDLHDISDGHELATAVQTQLSIGDRVRELKGQTSVKQIFSRNAGIAYRKMAQYIDQWLELLYRYIREHYQDDEIVISLFSDHGQGYLIEREDAHFLSEGRSNVPMMFMGSGACGRGVSSEIVSALDYTHIMRKLCGLEEEENETDGRLPELFGGESARSYALTESIHPGDPYQAAIFTGSGNLDFFYRNSEKVQDDGRFRPGKEEYWLEQNGEKVEDAALTEHYLSIVREHIAGLLIYE
ncbi:MAG: sulfatase-like hydrolase/transferase [Lachnospiraceae bacterium]|nr:sulfatase-like hydrolase/transferase [Lachnospiraceae bacterium]